MLNLFFLKMTTNSCVEMAGLSRNLRIHTVSRQQSSQRIPETWRTVWRGGRKRG